jgi:MFS transporter, DHA1 family, inner membrane transport protein
MGIERGEEHMIDNRNAPRQHVEISVDQQPTASLLRVLLLSVGAFAVGTVAYIVAGLLPDMANDLRVSQAAAGQSVAVFALFFAVLSPVLATLTGRVPRHRLLVVALAVLALGNLATAAAGTLTLVLVARAVAAAGAALYTPTAITVSASLVPERYRGRALVVVPLGLTAATVIGVPVGALIDQAFGWRFALVLVSVLTALVLVALLAAVPAVPPERAESLRTRLSVLGRPQIVAALMVTVLGIGCSYVVYPFVIAVVHQGMGLPTRLVSLMLLLYGIGALAATIASGFGIDRWGPRPMLVIAFSGLVLALAGLGVVGALDRGAVLPAVLLVVVWGAGTWTQAAPQQYRLMALAPDASRIAISLNASAIYVGIGLGTVIGGLLLAHLSVAVLPFAGAVLALATLFTLLFLSRADRAG